MAQEEDITRNLTLIEYYKQQLESLDLQLQMMQSALAEYQRARITVDQIQTSQSKTDILIPAGGGIYLNGALGTVSTMLVALGADYIMEKTPPEAITKLDDHIKRIQDNQERLYQLATRLQNEAEELSQKTQQMMDASQK
jgi:prefoldin alpha subunit